MEILPLRAYAHTKQAYDDHCRRGEDFTKLPKTPLMMDVMRNDFALMKAKRAARTRG